MSSLLTLSAELTGVLPGISPSLAPTFVQRAWRDVRNARLWSWQVQDCAIVCPAAITTGGVTFTQYGTTVTLDTTASAAVAAYITGTPLLTQMQIRFGTGTQGQIYQISSVNSTVPTARVLTLDRIIVDASETVGGYQIARYYVAAPVTDFTRWVAITDMANAYPLALDRTSAWFDQMDPQRGSQGLASYVGAWQNNSAGLNLYEFWPGPTSGQVFYAQYERRGADLSATVSQPDVIPDAMIMDRTLAYHAYPWAQVNAGHFPAMAKVNWSAAIKEARDRYLEAYRDVKRTDDEIRLTSIVSRGRYLRGGDGWGFPIDAAFIQNHLVSV